MEKQPATVLPGSPQQTVQGTQVVEKPKTGQRRSFSVSDPLTEFLSLSRRMSGKKKARYSFNHSMQ